LSGLAVTHLLFRVIIASQTRCLVLAPLPGLSISANKSGRPAKLVQPRVPRSSAFVAWPDCRLTFCFAYPCSGSRSDQRPRIPKRKFDGEAEPNRLPPSIRTFNVDTTQQSEVYSYQVSISASNSCSLHLTSLFSSIGAFPTIARLSSGTRR